MLSSPEAGVDRGEELLRIKEIIELLHEILVNQEKRRALVNCANNDAQSMIDYLSTLSSHPDFLEMADHIVRKHTLMALRSLCENTTLYPTCDILDGIEELSQNDGGGFCDIFQGRYRGQDICLKVMRIYQQQSQEQLLKAHAREAIVWSQLEHPCVTPFFGFFRVKEANNRIGLLSPWMENGNIVQYLRRNPDVARRPFVYDIASGLEYLHENNIVHGDLKGLNVLVNSFSIACLADFGVSKIITDGTLDFAPTTNLTPTLTPRWISPELLEEEARPTRESDNWGFGCVCFEVLTGLVPYRSCTTDAQVIRKLLSGVPPAEAASHTLDGDHTVNEHIWNLVGRCWSITATERPKCSQIVKTMEENREVWGINAGGLRYNANPIPKFQYTTTSNNLLDHDRARYCLRHVLNQSSTAEQPGPIIG